MSAITGPDFGSHSWGAMQPLDEILAKLEFRHNAWENHLVGQVSDLQITWHDQGPSKSKSGYYAKIDGKDMLLTEQALRSANKLIKSNVNFWSQHADRNAFPKTLAHILENRRGGTELLVRSDGLNVNAILPAKYKIHDASELLSDMIQPLRENVGDMVGISMLEGGDNDGDITSLRVVLGENIVPSLKSEFGQYMMFLINTSETGAINTETAMGTYRTSCTNSAIREQLLQRWDHKSEWDKFFDGTMGTIRQFSYYQSQFGQVFNALAGTRLEIPGPDLLRGLRNEEMITNHHYDAAEIWINQPTEDGRQVETQYDLFNVLTRSAQDLTSIGARLRAEQAAMKIFTQPGGIFERLQEAHNLRQRRGNVRPDEVQ